MKKINSNDYGAKIIGIGLVFLVVIPIALYCINCLLNLPIIQIIIYISMGIGGIIEIGFMILLRLELRQDRLIDKYYSENPTSTKTPQQILDEHRGFVRK